MFPYKFLYYCIKNKKIRKYFFLIHKIDLNIDLLKLNHLNRGENNGIQSQHWSYWIWILGP